MIALSRGIKMDFKLRKGFRDKMPTVTIDCSLCPTKPCCKYVVVKLDKKSYRSAKKDDGLKYLELHGFKIYITTKKKVLMGIPARCSALNKDLTCDIWETRPGVCSRNFLEFDQAGGLLCPKEAVKTKKGVNHGG